MSGRRVPAAVLIAAIAVVPVTAAPASAAVCATAAGADLCVESLTVSPSSVPNDRATTVTVTVRVSGPQPDCLEVAPPFSVNVPGSEPAFRLLRTSPTAATWSGTWTVQAFNRPGSYPWQHVAECSASDPTGTNRIDGDRLSVAAPLVIVGTNDTSGPVVRSLTVSPVSSDVTRANAALAVTARVTDDVSGAGYVHLSAQADRTPTTLQSSVGRIGEVTLNRTAGTARDGTWTGTLRLAGGTSTSWSLTTTTQDAMRNALREGPAALAARGLTSSVSTTTTAAPRSPVNVRATSKTYQYSGHLYVEISGTAQPAGTPMSTDWVVTIPAGCGTQGAADPGLATVHLDAKRRFCTYSVRAVNAAGRSGTVSVSAWIGK